MLRTRVGYAGGTKDKPTYRDLGDHTEAFQVEFDPRLISYEKLLELFWRGHDPWRRGGSTQYKSVLWTHGAEQARWAEASIEKLAARRDGKRPLTEVKAAGTFWLAEAYHQKYALRSRGALMVKVFGLDASDAMILDSPLAARLNGWLSGYGTPEEVHAELARLEVPEATRKVILEALGDRVRLACE